MDIWVKLLFSFWGKLGPRTLVGFATLEGPLPVLPMQITGIGRGAISMGLVPWWL